MGDRDRQIKRLAKLSNQKQSLPPLEEPPSSEPNSEQFEPIDISGEDDQAMNAAVLAQKLREVGANQFGHKFGGKDLPSGKHVEVWAEEGWEPQSNEEAGVTPMSDILARAEKSGGASDALFDATKTGLDAEATRGLAMVGPGVYVSQKLLDGPNGNALKQLASMVSNMQNQPKQEP